MNYLQDKFKYINDDVIYGLTDELVCFYVLNYFKKVNNNVIFLVSSIHTANKFYDLLRTHTENVRLYLSDELISISTYSKSYEFELNRLETVNEIISGGKNIIITNYLGFLKKTRISDNNIKLSVGLEIKRNELIELLDSKGYIKESYVTETREYASRGMLIDIFPINYDNPIRIIFNGNIIEEIVNFNIDDQISTDKTNDIVIYDAGEVSNSNYTNLYEISHKPPVFIYDNNIIKNTYLNDLETYNNLDINNDFYSPNDIVINTKYYIDSVNSSGNNNISEMINFNENEQLIKSTYDNYIKNNMIVTFCVENKKEKLRLLKIIPSARIVIYKMNKGFIYDNLVYICSNDLTNKAYKRKNTFISKFKIGKRIKSFNEIEIGDYVVQENYGIGIYSGISALNSGGIINDFIKINYANNDKVYIPISKINTICKYADKNAGDIKLNSLNSTAWYKAKTRARAKAEDISKELYELYRKRVQIKRDSYKYYEIEDEFNLDFEYELTKDQKSAINDIIKDMESNIPMDRLLCGDVGFGKTEVACRAIIRAVLNNKQVAYLCPTTILSSQQYEVIQNRFRNIGVNIALLNRFVSSKDEKIILDKLSKGSIDIVVGTHKLLSENIKFNNLGLLIIDEEQRFGVKHKEKIKEFKNDVDILTLSATPIPRTLKMALSGLRDLSIIDTPPVNRYPVQTYVLEEDYMVIKDAIYKEVSRKGQVFILYNNIEHIYDIRDKIYNVIPDITIAIAHGAMDKNEIEDVMIKFKNNEYDVLLATTIIENGIDITNANTIIILNSDSLGLSQLYQLRGRVGRGSLIGYAYMMYNKNKMLNDSSIKRLNAIKEFTELGSGYKIAMRDLSIRGAGDIFGSDQAGYIDDVGITLYMRMIEEEFKKIKGEDISYDEIDNISNLTIGNHIKDEYVSEDTIKIEIHSMINNIKSFDDLNKVKNEITDRFGKIDNDLLIYMHNKLFDYELSTLSIYKINKTNRFIEIILNDDLSSNIKGERLITELLSFGKIINISYINNKIAIKLYINNLDKHYIYYLLDIVEIIKKSVSSNI